MEINKKRGTIVIDSEYSYLVKEYWMNINPRWGTVDCMNKITRKRCNLSRLIMKPASDMVVDHINHNKLDNRVANLRVCRQLDNCGNRRIWQNKEKRMGIKSKGVYPNNCSKSRPFLAAIGINKKTKYLGTFATEQEASQAYNKKASEYFGEFALLN